MISLQEISLKFQYSLFISLFCNSMLVAQPGLKAFAGDTGTLQPFGLEGKVITSLAAEAQERTIFTYSQNLIFAGTNGDGVFQASPFDSSHTWRSLGLDGRNITALTVQHWGVGPIDGLKLLAAVFPNYQQNDSTLIYCREVFIPVDTAWAAADSGLDKSRLTRVNALNSYYFTGHRPPQPLVMGGEVGLFHANFANIWSEAEVEGIVKINAIALHPHWLGSLAWAVGRAGLSPAAFRSTDKGRSWLTFPLPSFIEGEAFSAAINPRHPDTVYVAQTGVVLMTPDSGKTWQETGLQNPSVRFHALAVDPFSPENVFAGGSTENNSFAFYHSTNGGTTWTQIQPGTEQEIAGVTSVVVRSSDFPERQTLVFIGTEGSGVWLYKPSIVTQVQNDSQIPGGIELHQNYPNPFNPETTISYEIAKPVRVVISVYNVLGQRIRTLVNAWQPAGIHRVSWDGTVEGGGFRVASGLYFYELRVEGVVLRKKMVLLE